PNKRALDEKYSSNTFSRWAERQWQVLSRRVQTKPRQLGFPATDAAESIPRSPPRCGARVQAFVADTGRGLSTVTREQGSRDGLSLVAKRSSENFAGGLRRRAPADYLRAPHPKYMNGTKLSILRAFEAWWLLFLPELHSSLVHIHLCS